MKLFHFLCYGPTTKRAFHPKTTKLYQSCNKKRTGRVSEVRTNGRGKGNKSSIGGSIRKRWSLNGFTALVTGDTRGIGLAVVEELAEFGATVYTCSRNEVALNKCLKEWKEKGFLVSGWVCDASSREQREKLIAEVASATEGKLNVLVRSPFSQGDYQCYKT